MARTCAMASPVWTIRISWQGACRMPETNPSVVYVLTQGIDIGSPIAAARAARGARVAWLSDGAEPAAVDPGPEVLRVAADFASRAELERSLAAAQEQVGPPTQVIVSAIPRIALQARDLAMLTDDDWRAA